MSLPKNPRPPLSAYPLGDNPFVATDTFCPFPPAHHPNPCKRPRTMKPPCRHLCLSEATFRVQLSRALSSIDETKAMRRQR